MTETEIELIVTQTEKKVVTIRLPIYREHAVDDYCTIYTRIGEDLSAVHIHKNTRSWERDRWGFEVEFEEKYVFDGSPEDYHQGKGIYSLSEGEFLGVLAELQKSIGAIGKAAGS